jgi:hypothetical protein
MIFHLQIDVLTALKIVLGYRSYCNSGDGQAKLREALVRLPASKPVMVSISSR